MQFIIGIIIFALGFLIVLKSEWMLNNFGRIAFFDQKFGLSGGTRMGYKLIGMGVLFIGILFMTGMIGGFIGWITSPLTRMMI